MRSNYKKIGDLIHLVDERNTWLHVSLLLWLTIAKKFIPSVANTVWTDMENYKVIRRNQFACSLMQVRRDKKMPVALLQEYDEAIISQAYPIFEVNDEKELLPEYLMMWFSREEFDREACFYAVGGVRGSLEWEDFCSMQLPVPDITKQQEIVDEYNTIKDRIALNTSLIGKLEETAQAVYREWFVDFEFPDENGNPYKSSGWEMEFCEELEKEVPKGWKMANLWEITENFDSKRKPVSWDERANKEKIYPYYWAAALMDYIDDYIFDGEYILLWEDWTVVQDDWTPVLQYVWWKFWANNHAHVLKWINWYDENTLYLLLRNTNIQDIITWWVQAKINQQNLNSISILKPNENILKHFQIVISPIFSCFKNKTDENIVLQKLMFVILAKMASEG